MWRFRSAAGLVLRAPFRLPVAVPKLCQKLFLTGFRRPVFGPQPASFLARFRAFCALRAAAFPRFEGLGHRFLGIALPFGRLIGLLFGYAVVGRSYAKAC